MTLKATVTEALELLVTNYTSDIRFLEQEFELVSSIHEIIDEGDLEALSSSVRSTHHRICELMNRTQTLMERSQSLKELQVVAENATSELSYDLFILSNSLLTLQSDILNVSLFLNSVDITAINSSISIYLEIFNTSVGRVVDVDMIIRTFFNVTLSAIQEILDFYHNLSQTMTVRNTDLVSQLDKQNARLDALEAFVDDVSVTVCGTEGNGSCEECGGVGCGMCGEGDDCEGLSGQAAESANKSSLALSRANELLHEIQSNISSLGKLVDEAFNLVNSSQNFLGKGQEIRLGVEHLLTQLQSILMEVETELKRSRIDPNLVWSNMNATLIIQMDLSVEKV